MFGFDSAKRATNSRDHLFNAGCRLSIGRTNVPVRFGLDLCVGHDFDFLRHVIENQQRLGQEKGKLRKMEVVFSPRRKVLKRLDDIIAEIPHGSTDKTRQLRHRHGLIGLKDLPQTIHGGASAGDPAHTPPLLDAQIPAVFVDDDRRSATEERIPRPFLPPLNAFQ